MLNSSQPTELTNHRGIFKNIRGLLENDQRQKTYRIRFAARSNLVATLGFTRFNTNVNLELLNSAQRVIAASRRLVNRPERIERQQLAPGTYYLRAALVRGQWSRFRLQATTTPIFDTSNTPSAASFIDVTSVPTTVGEFIGAEDSSDFYTFNVGGPGFPTAQLNLNLAGATSDFLNGNVTVKIRDSALNIVRQRTSSSQVGFSFNEPLAAGTYFVQVEPANPNQETNYRLSLAATPIADLAGNTPSTARPVSLSASSSLFQDTVGVGDSQDYYRFTIPKSRFNLKLTGPNGNLLRGEVTLRLRNDVNVVLEQESSGDSGAGLEINSKPLDAGTYIVQVFSPDKLVNYSLAMAAEPR